MNCAESKELMAAYIEGLLDEKDKQSVAEHLKDCASCRAELKEINNLRDRLVKNGKVLGRGDFENAVLDRIIREQNVRLKAATQISAGLKTWRIIMRSRITKLAAAAVIIIAVFVSLYQTSSSMESVAFADVVHSVLLANTATFDIVLEREIQPLQRSRLLCMAPGHIRQEKPDGTVHIVDYNRQEVVTLDTEKMTAKLTKLEPLQDAAVSDVLGELQQRVKLATSLSDDSVEVLGRRLVDGREAIGFRVQLAGVSNEVIGWHGKGTFTVWADPNARIPIRLEWYSDEFGGINTIATNIHLDPDLDESLFSMEIPQGYTLIQETKRQETILLPEFTTSEEKIVNALRNWTLLSGGVFPSSLDFDAIKDIDPNVDTSFIQKDWKGFEGAIHFSTPYATFKDNPPFSQEEVDRCLDSVLFVIFGGIQETIAEVSDWQYSGQGVKFGNADRAIFWYQPKGSKTYRVIYGDLTVEDVEADQLPK